MLFKFLSDSLYIKILRYDSEKKQKIQLKIYKIWEHPNF